jgi:hypothetical protein
MEDTIKPRLYAAGADMKRVFHLEVVTKEFENGITLSLPADFDLLENAIREKDAVEVYFDALMTSVDITMDAHKGRDARFALQPLGDIANRTACNITGNVHFNKSTQSDPSARILGSVEFRNVARAIIYFARDNSGTRVLSRGKSNLGQEWDSLEYQIEDASFEYKGDEYSPGLFVLGDTASVSAEDILRAENKLGSTGDSITQQAAVWLAGYMGEHGNKVEASKGLADAEAAGFKKRTIQKAMKRADVTSDRVGYGEKGHYVWERTTADTLPRKMKLSDVHSEKDEDSDDDDSAT